MSEASARGVSSLAREAEQGNQIGLLRHGRRVAEVISTADFEHLHQENDELREAVLVMARYFTDSGVRTNLDTAIEYFGFSRDELVAELDEELRQDTA